MEFFIPLITELNLLPFHKKSLTLPIYNVVYYPRPDFTYCCIYKLSICQKTKKKKKDIYAET